MAFLLAPEVPVAYILISLFRYNFFFEFIQLKFWCLCSCHLILQCLFILKIYNLLNVKRLFKFTYEEKIKLKYEERSLLGCSIEKEARKKSFLGVYLNSDHV